MGRLVIGMNWWTSWEIARSNKERIKAAGGSVMTQSEYKTLRVIIIDDDPDWRRTLGDYSKLLGHIPDFADSLEDAKEKIGEAERSGDLYSVALLDMNFEIGKTRIPIPQGRQVVKHIKTHHPYIACIMVSGSTEVTPDFVLDLRDEYDLDYFLEKQYISEELLSKAIQKATRRISPVGDPNSHTRVLKDSLEKWRSIYYLHENNLSRAKEREAIKGIDVDTITVHEIERYQLMLDEAKAQIVKIQGEIMLYENGNH
jgi:CheY-like chemotaxis protein